MHNIGNIFEKRSNVQFSHMGLMRNCNYNVLYVSLRSKYKIESIFDENTFNSRLSMGAAMLDCARKWGWGTSRWPDLPTGNSDYIDRSIATFRVGGQFFWDHPFGPWHLWSLAPLVPDLAAKGPPFGWNGPFVPLFRPLWFLKKAPLVPYKAPLVPYFAKDPYRLFTPLFIYFIIIVMI